MAKVHFQTLGCRLNQAESERMARGFKLAGHEVVNDAESADVRVLNTCTVTKSAGDESRRAAKAAHPEQRIVVTGCHSEMHPEDFDAADLIVANAEKEEMTALVQERFGMEGLALGMDHAPNQQPDIYPLTIKNTRAFVKIQDGCNLRCTFCLTTLARGVSRSRAADEIVEEIQHLSEQGCQEAVLTGVHAGSYGLDIHQDLGWLVDQILSRTTIPRIRLSSLEPWNFRDHWTPHWTTYGDRLCRHLHMSLQSGSRSVLKRMARCYDPETFAEKVQVAREAIPDVAITTDIICGFPGETDEEHQQTLDFVRQLKFAGAHLFTYSARPGTVAAKLPDQIEGAVKKARFQEMKSLIAETETAFQESVQGKVLPVLWEHIEKSGQLSGLTDNFIRVRTSPDLALPNTITPARMLANRTVEILTQTTPE